MSMSKTRPAALLVIGMQNDKVAMINKYLEKENLISSPFIKKVNTSIEMARDRGWVIIYAMDLHHSNHCSFAQQGRHCILGSWGSVQVSGLHYALPRSEQLVRGVDIDGDSNDAYYITDRHFSACTKESKLREIINADNLHPLYISGLSPEGCIEQTCYTAATFGHEPIIISDCTTLLPTLSSTFSNKSCTLSDLMIPQKSSIMMNFM
jgi:nicotinamidase-related amidase